MEDYLNYRRVAEIPAETYAVHCRRARAAEILVRHFDRDFHYFLRRRGKKKVTIFFKLPANPSRCWMCCAFLSPSSATIAEDLVNIFINRIADMLEYENKANSLDSLP